jgi:hypothetical protein
MWDTAWCMTASGLAGSLRRSLGVLLGRTKSRKDNALAVGRTGSTRFGCAPPLAFLPPLREQPGTSNINHCIVLLLHLAIFSRTLKSAFIDTIIARNPLSQSELQRPMEPKTEWAI